MNAEIVATIIEQQVAATKKGLLSMWTVYEHPADFPDNYVARCFVMDKPTDVVLVGSLEDIRESMLTCGLVCLNRQKADPQKIVETWV